MDELLPNEFVFVYGTLKQSPDYEGILQHSGFLLDSTFIGCGKTRDKFGMYDLIRFPAVTGEREDGHVLGEVYLVPKADIFQLDAYEGVPFLYNRFKVPIDLDSGKSLDAIMYVGHHHIGGEDQLMKPIKGNLEWSRN